VKDFWATRPSTGWSNRSSSFETRCTWQTSSRGSTFANIQLIVLVVGAQRLARLDCDERHKLHLFSRFFHLQQPHIPKKFARFQVFVPYEDHAVQQPKNLFEFGKQKSESRSISRFGSGAQAAAPPNWILSLEQRRALTAIIRIVSFRPCSANSEFCFLNSLLGDANMS
jgi:hypothetical protein